jgi:hypothetical protein
MNSEELHEMAMRVTRRAEMARRVAAQAEMVSRVAARAEIRRVASQVCSEVFPGKTASSRSTREILVAMAEGALIPSEGPVHVAGLGSLVAKLKQIASAIKANPNVWDHLKKMIGVESLDQLPGKLKELVKEGYHWLRKAMDHAFKSWPLKIYTFPEAKLISLNALIEKMAKMSPRFMKFLHDHVKPHVDQFDVWLRKNLPTVSKALMVGIYVWIWFNVVEFEWHLKDMLDAATGALSLSDLLASLPGSILGFMMNSLGFGTFTLFPAAFIMRLVVVTGARYLDFEGGSVKLNYSKLQKDFGMSHEELAELA